MPSILPSANKDSTSPFLLFIFSYLIALVKASVTTLNRSDESRILASFLAHGCFDHEDQKPTQI